MNEKITVVNPELRFKKVSLVEPTQNYYLQIGAEINSSPFPFFLTTSKKKRNYESNN